MSGDKQAKEPRKGKVAPADKAEDKRETFVLVPMDDQLKRGGDVFKNQAGYQSARFVQEIHVRSLQPGTVVHVLLPKTQPAQEVVYDARGYRVKKSKRNPPMVLSRPIAVADHWNDSEDQRHEGPRLHGDGGLLRAIADLAMKTDGADPMVLKTGRDDSGKPNLIRLGHC